jgi:hypothetical protein
MRIFRVGQSLAGAGLLAWVAAVALGGPSTANTAIASEIAESAAASSFALFLDRLMGAESAGLTHAKNPRSTALGPFQFIKSTFLDVARRHFPTEVADLSDEQLLERRTDRAFSRRAAEAFSRDNIGRLKQQGLQATFAQLRLAFLLGAADAARLVQADPQTPVVRLLSAPVIKANPFMARMTAADLLAKSVRDIEIDRTATMVIERPEARARPMGRRQVSSAKVRTVVVGRTCSRKLPSCGKLLALNAKKNVTNRASRSRGKV